ncbi:MAG: hypothetical protein Q8O79_08525 [Pseudomonadota bacterium]|nr:hypothetical protein [Pseudomonadota bacterium]
MAVLIPKVQIQMGALFFLATLIRWEGKFKYGYGRKWGLGRMKASEVRLPVADSRMPDWHYMQKVIQALPSQVQLTAVSA